MSSSESARSEVRCGTRGAGLGEGGQPRGHPRPDLLHTNTASLLRVRGPRYKQQGVATRLPAGVVRAQAQARVLAHGSLELEEVGVAAGLAQLAEAAGSQAVWLRAAGMHCVSEGGGCGAGRGGFEAMLAHFMAMEALQACSAISSPCRSGGALLEGGFPCTLLDGLSENEPTISEAEAFGC